MPLCCLPFGSTCMRTDSIPQQRQQPPPALLKSPTTTDSSLPRGSPTTARLLYRSDDSISIGQMYRYVVTYNDKDKNKNKEVLDNDEPVQRDEYGRFLCLKVRNSENNLFRPIYLTGPFSFYIDVTPYNYKISEKFDEKIQYDADIKPGVAFKGKLYINENSLVSETIYSWTVDVVSQLALTTGFEIGFTFLVGYDHAHLRKTSTLESTTEKETVLSIEKLDTNTIWNSPPKHPSKPVHLVLLTHGIFSNVGADLLYMRDRIYHKIKDNDEANIIIRGYDGNIGKSQKGIKYLGKRVGDYILKLYDSSEYNIDRISFIGHSLGGPVQAYAVFHIVSLRPDFFKKVIPVNFLALASPFLGILSDYPKAVSFAMDLGALGITGRDLTLRHKFPSLIKKHSSEQSEDKERTRISLKPTLEQILKNPVHGVFERFLRRTTYANAVNDGIVPLRTSALLYLDWKSLGQVSAFKKSKGKSSGNDNKSAPVDLSNAEGNDSNDNDKTRQEPTPSLPGRRKMLTKSSSSSGSVDRKKKKRNKVKKYLRTQTLIQDDSEQNSPSSTPVPPVPPSPSPPVGIEEVSEALDNEEEQDPELYIPPVASTVLSAANVILAREPDNEYLTDPSGRPQTIFHDKVYAFKDLPEPHYAKKLNPLKERSRVRTMFSPNKKAMQERIARSWHWKMNWRKVLVTLMPDAHNNIIVRRKFTNAWGWDVIEHLVDNHFSEDAIMGDEEHVKGTREKLEAA